MGAIERSALIESIYEVRSKDVSGIRKKKLDKLLYDVLLNNITVDDAHKELIECDPSFACYKFLNKIKTKPVYKSIKDYKANKLSEILKAKMISSLITQVLIQCENDETMSTDKLQLPALLNILSEYNESGVINSDLVDVMLENYGYDDEDIDDIEIK